MRRLLILLTALMVSVPASGALEETNGFAISDSSLEQKKDFTPIPGQNPVTPNVEMTLEDCKLLPSSVAIKVTWNIKSRTPTKARFALTWPAAEANDLDLYFFDEAGVLVVDSASADPQEAFNVGGLPNGTYWACVNNFSGPNAGYTLEIKAAFLSLYERSLPSPTPRPTSPPKTPPPATRARPTPPPEPTATPEDIEAPGPDGTAVPQDLLAVSRNRQAAEPEGGRSGLQIALLAIAGAVVVSGATIVGLRIRRDTRM
jgi:hypothetical protein